MFVRRGDVLDISVKVAVWFACAAFVCFFMSAAPPDAPSASEIWTFDRTDRLGNHPTKVEGEPKVISGPRGKAVLFDGVDDALFVDGHPLAGAQTFTWEAIFRPDGGDHEQRWFHLQGRNAQGEDGGSRMLFEIRVTPSGWYLDSFVHSGDVSKALIHPELIHPLGVWYHVAAVYDGTEFRSYVNGVQEGAAQLRLAPQGNGHSSVGVRINRVNYFKGAIQAARFTKRALTPEEFLK